ncbi:ATP-binding protein [Streptomyces sp. NBC_00846]|uniref:sensor histidine kinase n=1 Tax=Streptomyces sp. NBC_00846 TaxID=2975849 RepID=UPI0038671138|nr:ATP-binding protein [Streptomyces sp. NBC_00846]
MRYKEDVQEIRKGVGQLLGQADQAEDSHAQTFVLMSEEAADSFAGLAHLLSHTRAAAAQAVTGLAAERSATRDPQAEADAFVHIARRLHALVSRTLVALSDLEAGVEDPDLMHALFVIDHLVTRSRRATESIAVLGGHVPRTADKPLSLVAVTRQAVQEIEQYPRVRLHPPTPDVAHLSLPGYAGPDVVHLLAELVENAAKFSPPTTQVLIRVDQAPAGLAIEIEDRGLPMSSDRLKQMNQLLTFPEEIDLAERLRQGCIGLLVAARLARRHHIKIALGPSLLGGTKAVVVIPSALLVRTAARPQPQAEMAPPSAPQPLKARATEALAHQQPAPATGAAPPPQRRSSSVPGHSASRDRPALPRRSDAQRPMGADTDVSRREAPSGGASVGLMASYTAGIQRAMPPGNGAAKT